MTTTPRTNIDKTDIAIIVSLSQNPKATNAAIAKELRVAEETVRRRLKILFETGLVNIKITIDPRVFGFAENAVLTLKPARSKDIEVVNFAKEQIGVTNVYRVLESDGVKIVCEVSCLNVDDLNALIDSFMENIAIKSFRMQRISDPAYQALGYPGIR